MSANESNPALQKYFGTRLSPVSFSQWLDSLAQIIASGERNYLWAHHNLHSLYLLDRNPDVREFYKISRACYIDGMPIRLILAGAGVFTASPQRFSLMHEFPSLLEQAVQRGWSIFYLGSSAATVQAAQQRIDAEFPELRICLQHGYCEPGDAVVEAINAFRPDILLVGMGMPLQESWLLRNLARLDVPVAAQAGATLDYFAGVQAEPPVWLSNMGLAWLYRLLHDPRRMWGRYLLEPWALVLPTLKLWLRID